MNFGFDIVPLGKEAVKVPAREWDSASDQPVQVSMRPEGGTIRRSPSTDQKKVRREMQKKAGEGPNGFWCRYCGDYQSIRNSKEVRKMRDHMAKHEVAGHEYTPHDGPFVQRNPAQKVSAYSPGNARVGEPTPQTDPDQFTPEEIHAEIKYLMKLNREHRSDVRTLAYMKLLRYLAENHPEYKGASDSMTATRKQAYDDGTCDYCGQYGCSPNCPGPNGGTSTCPNCGGNLHTHNGVSTCDDCGHGHAPGSMFDTDPESAANTRWGARTAGEIGPGVYSLEETDIRAGARVRWDGDMANVGRDGTVTAVDGPWMNVTWDEPQPGEEYRRTTRVPSSIVESPRWRLLEASLQTVAGVGIQPVTRGNDGGPGAGRTAYRVVCDDCGPVPHTLRKTIAEANTAALEHHLTHAAHPILDLNKGGAKTANEWSDAAKNAPTCAVCGEKANHLSAANHLVHLGGDDKAGHAFKKTAASDVSTETKEILHQLVVDGIIDSWRITGDDEITVDGNTYTEADANQRFGSFTAPNPLDPTLAARRDVADEDLFAEADMVRTRQSLVGQLADALNAMQARGEIEGWSSNYNGRAPDGKAYHIYGAPYGDDDTAAAWGPRDLNLTPGEAADFCKIPGWQSSDRPAPFVYDGSPTSYEDFASRAYGSRKVAEDRDEKDRQDANDSAVDAAQSGEAVSGLPTVEDDPDNSTMFPWIGNKAAVLDDLDLWSEAVTVTADELNPEEDEEEGGMTAECAHQASAVDGLTLPRYGDETNTAPFTYHVLRPGTDPYDGEFSWDTAEEAVQDAYDELGSPSDMLTPAGTVIVVFKDGSEFKRLPWGQHTAVQSTDDFADAATERYTNWLTDATAWIDGLDAALQEAGIEFTKDYSPANSSTDYHIGDRWYSSANAAKLVGYPTMSQSATLHTATHPTQPEAPELDDISNALLRDTLIDFGEYYEGGDAWGSAISAMFALNDYIADGGGSTNSTYRPGLGGSDTEDPLYQEYEAMNLSIEDAEQAERVLDRLTDRLKAEGKDY